MASLNTKISNIANVATNYIPRATATGFVNGLVYDNGTNVTIGNSNGGRAFNVYSAAADNHMLIYGPAPSISLADAASGGSYQAKLALATSNGQFATGAAAGDFIISCQTGAIIWAANSVEKMRLTFGGNLGIGTSSPTSKLQVEGYGTANSIMTYPVAKFYGAGTGGLNIGTDGTNPQIATDSSGVNLTFLTRVSGVFYERMRINASGSTTFSGNININDTYGLFMGVGSEQRILAGGTSVNTYLTLSGWNGSSYIERMRVSGNGRNGTININGNVIESFLSQPANVGNGGTCSITIQQVQYEWETSYIYDIVGLYAPSGTNVRAFATGIAHFFTDGGANDNNVATITSTGWSVNSNSNNSGTFNIVFTNNSGYTQNNINIRVLKINRMN